METHLGLIPSLRIRPEGVQRTQRPQRERWSTLQAQTWLGHCEGCGCWDIVATHGGCFVDTELNELARLFPGGGKDSIFDLARLYFVVIC